MGQRLIKCGVDVDVAGDQERSLRKEPQQEVLHSKHISWLNLHIYDDPC